VCAVGLGAAGIAIAWLLYVRKWRPVPEPWPIVEDKFLFDELYDAELYRPAVRLSLALQRLVERPVIAGSIAELAKGFRFGSVGLGRVQNGLVRSYALVLTSGIAVLAVVFIASR
jgi:NADH-quinone oxidoreductase subunit L